MPEPLTHRERAREVAYLMGERDSEEDVVSMIAGETFPRELVKAARGLLRVVRAEARYREGEYVVEFATPEIQEAEIALDLYKEPDHD